MKKNSIIFLIKIYTYFLTINSFLYGKKATVLIVEPYEEFFYYSFKSLLKIKNINFTNKILKL
jgi:hypothetical protein